MGPGHVGHAVVVGGHEGHTVQGAQIPHQRSGQGRALLGVGAPGELVHGHEEKAVPGLAQQGVQQVDLLAEGGQAAGPRAAVGQNEVHPVEQGQGGGLGEYEEAALAQKQGEHGGAQGHRLAAHVGSGDDGASGAQFQIQRGELLPPLRQILRHLGVNDFTQGDGFIGAEGGADTVVTQGQLALGHDQIQVAQGLHVG